MEICYYKYGGMIYNNKYILLDFIYKTKYSFKRTIKHLILFYSRQNIRLLRRFIWFEIKAIKVFKKRTILQILLLFFSTYGCLLFLDVWEETQICFVVTLQFFNLIFVVFGKPFNPIFNKLFSIEWSCFI